MSGLDGGRSTCRMLVFHMSDGFGEPPSSDLREDATLLLPEAVLIADYGASLLMCAPCDVFRRLDGHMYLSCAPEHPSGFEE